MRDAATMALIASAMVFAAVLAMRLAIDATRTKRSHHRRWVRIQQTGVYAPPNKGERA